LDDRALQQDAQDDAARLLVRVRLKQAGMSVVLYVEGEPMMKGEGTRAYGS
jgi:hypothetical protein